MGIYFGRVVPIFDVHRALSFRYEEIEYFGHFIKASSRVVPQIDDDLGSGIPKGTFYGSRKIRSRPLSEGRDLDVVISVIELLVLDILHGDLLSRDDDLKGGASSEDEELHLRSGRSLDLLDGRLEREFLVNHLIVDLQDPISGFESSPFRGGSGEGGDDGKDSWLLHIDLRTDSFEFPAQLLIEVLRFGRREVGSISIAGGFGHAFDSTPQQALVRELLAIIV